MKDFVGNELEIGDDIVYCRSRKNGMDMIVTKVIEFTPKMVKVDVPSISKPYSIVSPNNCVLYRLKELE